MPIGDCNKKEQENLITLIIEGLESRKTININEKLTIDNIKAHLLNETSKNYNITYKNRLLNGQCTIKEA